MASVTDCDRATTAPTRSNARCHNFASSLQSSTIKIFIPALVTMCKSHKSFESPNERLTNGCLTQDGLVYFVSERKTPAEAGVLFGSFCALSRRVLQSRPWPVRSWPDRQCLCLAYPRSNDRSQAGLWPSNGQLRPRPM